MDIALRWSAATFGAFFYGALKCLFADANFEDPDALQDTLFEEG